VSLHKYLYANSDPTNLNDPTGRYSSGATEEMFVVKEISNLAKAVVAAYAIGMILDSVFSHLDYINEQTGVRELEAAVAGASTSGITQSEFDALDRRVAGTAPRRRVRSLYLHYSFEYHADSLVSQGLLAKPYGQATKTAYTTGWSAHYALALPSRDIQDSVYIVWPKMFYEPTPPWGSTVAGITDDADRVLPGLGREWTFRSGSGGPGTVFGPISIPLGDPPPGVTQ
jgi:hypothetical protein